MSVCLSCDKPQQSVIPKKGMLDNVISDYLAELIEKEEFCKLTCTIYYMPPNAFTYFPYDEAQLMRACAKGKIVIDGEELSKHSELLVRMNSTLIAASSDYDDGTHDFRIHYVFETQKGEILLRVSMEAWREKSGKMLWVNKREVEDERAFFEFLLAFLPEYEKEQLTSYIDGVTQRFKGRPWWAK